MFRPEFRLLVISFLACSAGDRILAAPPATDYYLVATGTTAGSAIGSSDDASSGAASCTLRDALDIVNAALLPANSPANGCQITLIGSTPPSPVYVINLPAGSYTYTLVDVPAEELEILNGNVFIVGDDPATTIIQAAVSVDDANNRVLGLFQSTVEISATTLRHGLCTVSSGMTIISCGQNEFLHGGGVLVRNASTLTLVNARVQDNKANSSGGGIYTTGGSVLNVLGGSVISGNVVEEGGSSISGGGIGIRNSADQVLIDASTVSGNSVGEFAAGGGIQNSGSLTVQNGSLISGNTAGRNGGGIANGFGATTVIDASTVQDNVSTGGSGGGIYSGSFGAMLTVRNGSQVGAIGAANEALSQGGSAGRGGGIFNDFQSTLTVDASSVSYNLGNYGGGIANVSIAQLNNGSTIGNNGGTFTGGGVYNSGLNANLMIDASVISNNYTTGGVGRGGGIANEAGGIVQVVNGSIIGGPAAGNEAAIGGGIASDGEFSSVTVEASEVTGNQASNGGGIYNSGEAVLMIVNGSDIGLPAAPNTATIAGGGIFNTGDGELTVDQSTIASNVGVFNGGGIYNEDGATALVRNASQVSGNLTTLAGGFDSGGAGVFNGGIDGANTTIRDSSLSGNISAQSGGAVFNGSATFSEAVSMVTIENSILDGNHAHISGGGIRNRSIGTGGGASATVVVTDSSLTGNSTDGTGGAVSNEAQPGATVNAVITGSVIGGPDEDDANIADEGGGVYNLANGITAVAVTVINNGCRIEGNSADQGGGIWNGSTFDGDGTFTITDSHVKKNHSADEGGGIYNFSDD